MKSVYAGEKNCCGCGACHSACPSNAIAMRTDERGFSYPVIDHEKCTDSSCRNCTAVCPMIWEDQLRSANDPVRVVSPFENAFEAISEAMLRMGGVVFDTGFRCAVEKKISTHRTHEEAIRALREGRSVLFAGTSCETAGMRGLMKRKVYPQNLYTCDTICRDRAARPSCSACAFPEGRHPSDITVADEKGVSTILIHSAKGQALFETAKADLALYRHPTEKLSA